MAQDKCPVTKPGSYYTNCYMTKNHLAKMCRPQKDWFKTEFEKKKRDLEDAELPNTNTHLPLLC